MKKKKLRRSSVLGKLYGNSIAILWKKELLCSHFSRSWITGAAKIWIRLLLLFMKLKLMFSLFKIDICFAEIVEIFCFVLF